MENLISGMKKKILRAILGLVAISMALLILEGLVRVFWPKPVNLAKL